MRERFHKFFVGASRCALAVYFGLVIWVCFGHFDSLPDMSRPIWGIPQDKIIHFIMFFPFPIITAFALNIGPRTYGKAFLETLLILLCGFAVAAATEVIQGMTTYRDQNLWDWVADATALTVSSLMVLIALLIQVRRKWKKPAA